MDKTLENILVCPGCHGPLTHQAETLICTDTHCQSLPRQWPMVRGVPVMFDEAQSFFRIADARSILESPGRSRWHRWLSKAWHARPGLDRNVAAERNYRHLEQLLRDTQEGLVLVVGCGDEGVGIHHLRTSPHVTLIGLDIRWTASVAVIGDAQQLPFSDEVFDAVVLQGVLEHVLDIFQVEKEVFRILKAQGLVYCELPFLQPNHGGAFDLTRFTWTGHRRFWRRFTQLEAGVCCGPGMAMANMVQQFARAWLPFRAWRILSDWLTDWLFWWLKYLDDWLTKNPASLDGASGLFFLGRKSDHVLSDAELIATYRGGQ